MTRAFCALLVLWPLLAAGAPLREWSVAGGALGPLRVYAPPGPPVALVLLLPGEEGPLPAAGIAGALRDAGALVAVAGAGPGIAGSIEAPFRALAGRAGARYQPPLVVGLGSGGDRAYEFLRHQPAGALGGAVSVGFCAAGRAPPASLPAPWVVVAGDADATCPPAAIRAFLAGVPGTKFVGVPGAGHRVERPAEWLDAVRDSVLKLATRDGEPAARPSPVGDLPLTEVMAPQPSPPALTGTFVLLLTGDGGYAGLDRDVAGALAAQGLPVVALSTLRYFWAEREPGEAARDLGRVITYYTQAWHRRRVLLVGYSFGANVLPFIVPRLPAAARGAVGGVGLVAPATHTGFEIHVADWIPGSVPKGEPVLPAVQAMGRVPLLCIYSSGEPDALCPHLPPARARRVDLPGGHHFDGDSATLAGEILRFAGRK